MRERRKKILIVDDVSLNHAMASSVLQGDYELFDAFSAEEAFKMMETMLPDLILLDIVMPEMNGIEMIKILKQTPIYKDIPVIFLTGNTNSDMEVQGFDLGIVDYILKPFVPTVMKKRVETQLELSEYRKNLERKVEEKIQEMEQMYDLVTVSFAGLVESRDGVTGGHLKNTSLYFTAFINYLKSVPKFRDYLPNIIVKKACRCAPLHDVGKIAIRDEVLQKPASLSENEFRQMKAHTVIGGELFAFLQRNIPDKEFARLAGNIARYHHERWDGTGYPEGLKGEEIPLEARIMSIVDVYDALTSERPYKKAFSHEKAVAMIASGSGTQFDPSLVEEFMNTSNVMKECLETKESMIAKKEYFSPSKYL